jgi:tRNA A-37 threonylcarbamoyl transferase component Bud32
MSSSLQAPLAPPHTIGPYRVVHEIGHGDRGAVYLAEDSRFGRMVALREVPASWTDDPVEADRLQLKARAAATLSHQNVAATYALEHVDERIYLASEFVPGRSLGEVLHDGQLPFSAVVSIGRDIAAGLSHVHRAGIAHHHLRADAVIRTPEERIKIIGLAEHYGAPLDDQQAFGALLRTMAPAATPLDPIIQRCMASNPGDRFPTMDAVIEALDNVPAWTAPVASVPARGAWTPLWWWQCHQLATCLGYGMALYFLWAGYQWLPGPAGQRLLIAGLIAAVSANTLRLHLWLVSIRTPADWDTRRRDVWAWTRVADFVLGASLLLAGARHLEGQPQLSAVLLGSALLVLVAFTIIEPATTRSATSSQPRHGR